MVGTHRQDCSNTTHAGRCLWPNLREHVYRTLHLQQLWLYYSNTLKSPLRYRAVSYHKATEKELSEGPWVLRMITSMCCYPLGAPVTSGCLCCLPCVPNRPLYRERGSETVSTLFITEIFSASICTLYPMAFCHRFVISREVPLPYSLTSLMWNRDNTVHLSSRSSQNIFLLKAVY